MGGSRLATDMAYEDFAALIVHMDGEAQFRRPRDSVDRFAQFFATANTFRKECREYRAGMVRYWKAFSEHASEQDDPYPNFIYNPVSFVTFGDSDSISVVGIDDFHPTAWLAASTIPMRQTCLAFCPKPESLGLDAIRVGPDNARQHDVFCSARDLFPTDKVPTDPGRILISEERPLVAVSYFKLNAMAIVGPGVLFQEAVFRAMGRAVGQSLAMLRERTKDVDEAKRVMFSEEDVDSFRCVLLDPQGWSDVCALMFARNYSVIMSVMATLRQLTFARLYDTQAGQQLQEAVKCFGIHERIAEQAARIARDRERPVDENPLLSKNHVFCSTYTTLGVTQEAFRTCGGKATGYVAASTEVEVDPGHLGYARKAARVKRLQTQVANLDEVPFFWCTIGQGDASLPHLVSDGPGADRPVEVRDLLRQIVTARDCDVEPGREDGRLSPHTLGMSTILRVPILFTDIQRTENDHMDMRSVLTMLQDKLFLEEGSPLELNRLRNSLGQIRISAPASQAVVDLFAEYASCIADPFLVERVIDLFDVFCATYELLARELPKRLQERIHDKAPKTPTEADHICHVFLQDPDIHDLVELVGVLQNALTHRLRPAFRDAKRWGTSLDTRGGNVDKLVNAADAPLKCGLGILRRVMNGWTDIYEPPSTRSDQENTGRIGGTSLISCNLRSTSRQLCVGPIDDIFIASVNLSTIHLTKPSAFCIHLHETAHLICDLLGRGQCPLRHKAPRHKICYRNRRQVMTDGDQIILERHKDIFSEMLLHYFVFGDDYRTYLRNYITNYSLDPIAYCEDDGDSFRRMFEVFVRGFLTTEPFRAKTRDPELYALPGRDRVPGYKIKEAYAEFKAAVRDAGPFFTAFHRLWREDHREFDAFVFKMFSKVYKSMYAPLCCMWKDATRIFKGVTGDNPGKKLYGTDIADATELHEVIAAVKAGLDEGRPLARAKFKIKDRGATDESIDRLDPFLLVRLLLREHITSLVGAPQEATSGGAAKGPGIDTATTQVCLIRRASTGEPFPEALPKNMKWHTQLIDRNCNGLFAVEPSVRSDYMRQRIAVIKTLWDVGTSFQARRLVRVLQMAWPTEQA